MDQTSHTITGYSEPMEQGEIISAHRVKVFIGLAVLITAFGYFAFVAFQSATRFYYTVGELHQSAPASDGKMVRVSGKLVPGSFVRDEGSTVARFTLTDGIETLAAVHDGVLPDLFFNEHSDIILEGSVGPEGLFESYDVSVKCPSKYIAVE